LSPYFGEGLKEWGRERERERESETEKEHIDLYDVGNMGVSTYKVWNEEWGSGVVTVWVWPVVTRKDNRGNKDILVVPEIVDADEFGCHHDYMI